MHSKPVRILKSFEESQAFDFQYECGEVLSCPHSPDDSPIPFPDSSPQHSESSDDSCDYTDRLAFFPAEIKEDFESIASILVTLRSAPVIKNVSSPLPSSKENVFVLSEPQEDTKMMVSSSEKEDQHMQSDSGSESEIEEVEIDCDDEWNERIDGTESKGCINKGSGGFACEKHKRWKKRCPSWCPMRKENFKNIKNGSTKLSSEHPMESPNSSGSEGQSRRKRNYAKITSSSSMEDFITISNTPIRVSPVNTIACQFHAQLHARCPLNCPDRRVKTNVRKKQKKAEESDGRRATI